MIGERERRREVGKGCKASSINAHAGPSTTKERNGSARRSGNALRLRLITAHERWRWQLSSPP